MPTLKDYLGSLVKDLNHARVIADIESAHIAEMYADHALLKHFSIPRMKIRDTELTIPVSIDSLEMVAEKDYQPVDNRAFYAKTYGEIKNMFAVPSFSKEVSATLRRSIYKNIGHLERAIKSGESIEASLDNFSRSQAGTAAEIISADRKGSKVYAQALKDHGVSAEKLTEKMSLHLTRHLHPEIRQQAFTGKIENSKVTIESDKLKEKKPESLLYIKMRITEESMEWQTMEDAEGNVVSKLMVE